MNKKKKDARQSLIENLSKEMNLTEEQLKPMFLLFEKHLLTVKLENKKLTNLLKKSISISKTIIKENKQLKEKNLKGKKLLQSSIKQTKNLLENYKQLKENTLTIGTKLGVRIGKLIEKKYKKEISEARRKNLHEDLILQLKTILENYGHNFGFKEKNEVIELVNDLKEENYILKKKIKIFEEEAVLETMSGDVAQAAPKMTEEDDLEECGKNENELEEGEKFDRCVKKVKAGDKEEKYNPYAVCHASIKDEGEDTKMGQSEEIENGQKIVETGEEEIFEQDEDAVSDTSGDDISPMRIEGEEIEKEDKLFIPKDEKNVNKKVDADDIEEYEMEPIPEVSFIDEDEDTAKKFNEVLASGSSTGKGIEHVLNLLEKKKTSAEIAEDIKNKSFQNENLNNPNSGKYNPNSILNALDKGKINEDFDIDDFDVQEKPKGKIFHLKNDEIKKKRNINEKKSLISSDDEIDIFDEAEKIVGNLNY